MFENFKNVIFSDEVIFDLHGKKPRMWMIRGEKCRIDYIYNPYHK